MLYGRYVRTIKRRGDGRYLCRPCSVRDPKCKAKISAASKKNMVDPNNKKRMRDKLKGYWDNPDNRAKASRTQKRIKNRPDVKSKMSETSKKLWQNSEFREKVGGKLKSLWSDPEIKDKAIAGIKSHSAEYSKRQKKRWQDPEYRKLMASYGKPVSNLQKILYSLLDDCGVGYEPEFVVGFNAFDCMIPREGRKDLLIEVQGDYFHNRPEKIIRDKQKATFISRYYSDQYELKTIWEHEFKEVGKVLGHVRQWCGLEDTEIVDFDFKKCKIANIFRQDANIFCGKYHYMANAGRSGQFYGAILNGKTIAICGFAAPTRRESIKDLDLKFGQVRELTRFAISDPYHKKNFASYILGRFVRTFKRDNDSVCGLISFADETFGHVGTIYQATNWKFVHIVPPDYHYVSEDGKTIHKKTLYDHAKKMGMKELEYAKEHRYHKVYGKQKRKYILKWKLREITA